MPLALTAGVVRNSCCLTDARKPVSTAPPSETTEGSEPSLTHRARQTPGPRLLSERFLCPCRYPSPPAGSASAPGLPAAEESLEYVRTLYDFPGNDAEDLPFRKGEILVIVEKPEEQWWSARNKDGRAGMIPVPYVEKLARASAQGRPGGRNSSSYGVPEPAHAYAQPQTMAPPPAAGAPGATVSPLPSTQNGPVFAKAIQKRVPCAYDKTALALEVKAARLGLWGFDTWVSWGLAVAPEDVSSPTGD